MSFYKTNWFNGVTTAQTTEVEDLTGIIGFSLQTIVQVSGNDIQGVLEIDLQNSLDGTNFSNILSIQYSFGAPQTKMLWTTTPIPVKFVRLQYIIDEYTTGDPIPAVYASVLGV